MAQPLPRRRLLASRLRISSLLTRMMIFFYLKSQETILQDNFFRLCLGRKQRSDWFCFVFNNYTFSFILYRHNAWSSIVCSAFTHRPRKPDLSLGLWCRPLAILRPHFGCLLQEIKYKRSNNYRIVRFRKPTHDSLIVKWGKANSRQSPVAVGRDQKEV